MPQTGILITIFQTISTMAIKTRAQLIAANDALFTANGAKEITGPLVNTFEGDFIDSVALPAELFKDITKAALATAITNSEIIIGTRYRITDATAGVVVVWGIDSDVISTFGYVEGNYDGATWTISRVGNYDLENDVFYDTGLIIFKLELSASDILGGTTFDISQCPAPGAGYAWVIVECSVKLNFDSTEFDGTSPIFLGPVSSPYQFVSLDILVSNFSSWSACVTATGSGSVTNLNNVVENEKLVVFISPSPTVGDGNLVIYGSARLIKM
jgi:hypothetical protein